MVGFFPINHIHQFSFPLYYSILCRYSFRLLCPVGTPIIIKSLFLLCLSSFFCVPLDYLYSFIAFPCFSLLMLYSAFWIHFLICLRFVVFWSVQRQVLVHSIEYGKGFGSSDLLNKVKSLLYKHLKNNQEKKKQKIVLFYWIGIGAKNKANADEAFLY